MQQLCSPPLNKYEWVHLFFVFLLRVYTLCVDVCAHSGIIFSSFFFFFWMASNEKPTRAHTKGEPWRLKERRAAGETGPIFALSICHTLKHAAEKEKKKKRPFLSLSLNTLPIRLCIIYNYIQKRKILRFDFSRLFSRLLAYGHISCIASFFFLLLL